MKGLDPQQCEEVKAKSFNTFYHKELVPSCLQTTSIKHYNGQQ